MDQTRDDMGKIEAMQGERENHIKWRRLMHYGDPQ